MPYPGEPPRVMRRITFAELPVFVAMSTTLSAVPTVLSNREMPE